MDVMSQFQHHCGAKFKIINTKSNNILQFSNIFKFISQIKRTFDHEIKLATTLKQ